MIYASRGEKEAQSGTGYQGTGRGSQPNAAYRQTPFASPSEGGTPTKLEMLSGSEEARSG